MNKNVTECIVDADQVEAKKKEFEANGLTVVKVEDVTNRDNKDSAKVRITAKNFAAKLGHIDREFID